MDVGLAIAHTRPPLHPKDFNLKTFGRRLGHAQTPGALNAGQPLNSGSRGGQLGEFTASC